MKSDQAPRFARADIPKICRHVPHCVMLETAQIIKKTLRTPNLMIGLITTGYDCAQRCLCGKTAKSGTFAPRYEISFG
jgi:hypothetical protein